MFYFSDWFVSQLPKGSIPTVSVTSCESWSEKRAWPPSTRVSQPSCFELSLQMLWVTFSFFHWLCSGFYLHCLKFWGDWLIFICTIFIEKCNDQAPLDLWNIKSGKKLGLKWKHVVYLKKTFFIVKMSSCSEKPSATRSSSSELLVASTSWSSSVVSNLEQ